MHQHPSHQHFAVAVTGLLLSLSALAADVGTDTLKANNASLEACATGLRTALASYKPDAATANMKQAVNTGEQVQSLSAAERGVYSGLVSTARLCAAAQKTHSAIFKDLADMAKAGKTPPADAAAEFDKINSLLQATGEAMAAASKIDGFTALMLRVMSGKG